jgi:post-segregation antitoxin (ccd killing protein)
MSNHTEKELSDVPQKLLNARDERWRNINRYNSSQVNAFFSRRGLVGISCP